MTPLIELETEIYEALKPEQAEAGIWNLIMNTKLLGTLEF